MNDMEEKRNNREIKVRLHHIDRGNCTEVWEVKPENGRPTRYLGRDDGFGPKEWYTLCDAPYGYCERNCHVREDLTLVICDKDWNEVLRDGMDRKRFPESFPSLDEACNEAWRKVVKELPHVTRNGFGEWITKQSFLPLNQTEMLNWRDCYNEEEASETLSRFTWIGEEYAIFKVTRRHTKCDAQWYEYYAGKTNRHKNEGYARFFAYEYHDRHIRDVLGTLGRRCDDISRAVVETRMDHYYGRTVSHFMDEFIGYDMSYEQVCDAKEYRLRKAHANYNEANAYYYRLKENEESIRGIEALLLLIREQIQKAGENNGKKTTCGQSLASRI
uniref:Uncharacterized protein n=1 Tax=virus sp. ct5rm7 TaxID=2827298 RepID=A0A8S5RFS2_9VIRU|nr:MAG TPA: hypothetical protein [virus sp. ct5rm7]